VKLPDSDIQTCVHGLCVAADRFDADAATSREIGNQRLAEQFERQAKETRELARRLEDAAAVDVGGAMSRDAFLRACAANKALRFADGRYVVAAERSTDRAICWAGAVDGAVLRAIFAEVDRLGLKRPIKVYGYVCSVGETETFRFEQVR